MPGRRPDAPAPAPALVPLLCDGSGPVHTFPCPATRSAETFRRVVAPVAADADTLARGASGVRFVTGGDGRRTAPKRWAAAPAELWLAARLVSGLPTVAVRPLDDDAGRHIVDAFSAPSNRVQQGVLALPDEPAQYLKGKARQAVRTNLTRGRELGVEVRDVDPSELPAVLEQLNALRPDAVEWSHRYLSPIRRTTMVTTPNGGFGLSSLIVSGPVAAIAGLVVEGSPEESHFVRHALHAAVVHRAIEAGAKLLLVENSSPLRIAPGLQEFQRRTGYVPAGLCLAFAR